MEKGVVGPDISPVSRPFPNEALKELNISRLPSFQRARLGRLRNFAFRSSGGILAATALLFVLGGMVQPESVGSGALSGMVPFAAILAVAALGQTLVIQQGGIDLSVAGMISLSGVIVAYFSHAHPGEDSTIGLGLVVAFVAAVITGLTSGLLVSRGRVPPIVATIGVNALLYGVNIKISGGTPVPVPESLSDFASAKLLGVSSLAYVAIAVAFATIVIVKKTVFGRTFEAVGANAKAARAAGVTPERYRLFAYVMASCLYCLAGIFLAGLMTLPSAFQGDAYLMPTIAAVVIGGTSLLGGKGNLAASVIAAIFLTQLQQLVLTTGSIVGVQYLFQGAAIIVGVGMYSVDWKRVAASIFSFRGKKRLT
jgi:ribose transport system permease protein